MRIWLVAASFVLWSLSAQQEYRPRFEAGFWYAAFGWLQPGIANLGSGDGGMPDGGYRLSRHGEAGVHVAR